MNLSSINALIRKYFSKCCDTKTVKTFTAAELDFNVEDSRVVVIPGVPGKIIVPVSVWVYISAKTSIPANIPDKFFIGIPRPAGSLVLCKTGEIRGDFFTTTNAAYMCVPNLGDTETVFQRTSDLVGKPLVLQANQNDQPNNMSGGAYTFKMRIRYELLDINDFI